MTHPINLSGCSIFVTRPKDQSVRVAQALEAAGAQTTICPMMRIEGLSLDAKRRQQVMNLDQYAAIIVTSQHAAAIMGEWVDTYWPQLPAQQSWHAIGRASAQALGESGIPVDLPSRDHTSESLISELGFDWKDKRILIVKGEGGRDQLIQHFQSCGAVAETIACYRREPISYTTIDFLEKIVRGQPTHLLGLSAETVSLLSEHIQQSLPELYDTPIIVASPRVSEVASQLGFKLPYVTRSLQTTDLIHCIAQAS